MCERIMEKSNKIKIKFDSSKGQINPMINGNFIDHFSKRGLILVRIIMMDPSDKEELNRIVQIQKTVTTESI